jgi:O-antigen ligase
MATIMIKYRQDYVYLLLQVAVVSMINLDGIKLPGLEGLSMDIVFTGILTIVFVVLGLYMHVKLEKLLVPFILYIVMNVLSLYSSPVIGDSIKFLMRQFFVLSLLIVVSNYIMTKSSMNKLIELWFKTSLLPASLAILQSLAGFGVVVKEEIGSSLTRGYGLTSHPNFLAYYLVMLLLVVTILYFEKELKIQPIVFYSIASLNIIALILTFSRTALGGLLIGLAMYFFKKYPKRLLILPFFLIGVLFIPGVGTRLLEIFDFDSLVYDSSFAWRLGNWSRILNLLDLRGLLLGNGFKSILYYVNYAPHNEYIGFIFESGLIGAFAFFIFLISLLVKSILTYRNESVFRNHLLAGIILIIVSLIMAFTDNFYSVPSSIFYFWLYLALMLNIHRKVAYET